MSNKDNNHHKLEFDCIEDLGNFILREIRKSLVKVLRNKSAMVHRTFLLPGGELEFSVSYVKRENSEKN